MQEYLYRTPLFDLSVDLKARMVGFSGWEMPVQYSGIAQEHQAVRQGVGMFDISHMGKFTVQGVGAIAQLQPLVPSNLARLKPGEAQYTVLLNPEGGIIDDLIVYLQSVDEQGLERIIIIVNASTTEKDKSWMLQHLDVSKLEFQDISGDRTLIAVQGPKAVATFQQATNTDLSTVPRFGHVEATVFGVPAWLARTGYTGEDGFEVMTEVEAGRELWRSLITAGVVPCGLGARDTLRLEAAMALYGQDITDSTSPLEAGLAWLVHLDEKGDFIGRSVLEQQKREGVTRRLVGLQMQGRNIARHDYPVLVEGNPVGVVTSGTLSPTLGYPVALAYVPAAVAKMGRSLDVEIRGKTYPATVVKRPFYKGSA